MPCIHGYLLKDRLSYTRSVTIFPEKWFCSIQCERSGEHKDEVLNYSMKMIYMGLQRRVRVDAVREGDGPRMLRSWKIDVIDFHNNHPRYLRLGHRLLACKFNISYISGHNISRIKYNNHVLFFLLMLSNVFIEISVI